MAKQIIDIGSGELIGDGETIREAFRKANENFTELYSDDADFETQFNTHLNTASAGTNHILSWDGSDYVWRVDNDTIGIQLTDLSVNFVEGAADGDGSLLYDQGSGVFQYSPPKLNGLLADGDTDFGSNKIKYANMYPTLGDLPNASVYHGMFAHVHATGKGYFAHGGNWVELANQSDIVGTFSGLSGKPTTIAGYGITDALELGTTSTTALAGDTVIFDSTTPGVAIGLSAGETSQGLVAVALGRYAGNSNQGNYAIAVGQYAGETSQGGEAVAIGMNAGQTTQANYAQAIGNSAGKTSQGQGAVALGSESGETNQGTKAVAIGNYAGENTQGANAIAIGEKAGQTNQAANSIVLNATGAALENTTADSFVVKPIRNASGTHSLEYNPTTGEVTYDTAGGGAADTDALPEGTTNLYYTDARVGTYLGNNDYDTATNIVASITDSAPATLDTLNELAAALGDDANFSTTVTTSIAEKLPLAGGTMTGDINVGGNSIVGGNSPINIAPGGTASINLSADETITTGKILFSNVYANLVDLPSASTYHGMFAHVHATGKAYFAHGGNWVELANMSDVSGGGLANVVEDTTPQLGGDLDCQGFNITMDNGSISTTAGNLQISSFNYVTIDSANDGQIEIGRASGTGDVIIGKESNGTSVSFEGVASFDEQVLMYKGAEEKYSALTGATGTVAHDCDNGKMFYHTTPAADWTANFTNLNLNQYKFSTSVGIVVTQGNTAYIPNAVEIGGVAQTIIWQGNSTPTGTDNGTDAISFTIMRDGSTYIVLGQLTSFGGV